MICTRCLQCLYGTRMLALFSLLNLLLIQYYYLSNLLILRNKVSCAKSNLISVCEKTNLAPLQFEETLNGLKMDVFGQTFTLILMIFRKPNETINNILTS